MSFPARCKVTSQAFQHLVYSRCTRCDWTCIDSNTLRGVFMGTHWAYKLTFQYVVEHHIIYLCSSLVGDTYLYAWVVYENKHKLQENKALGHIKMICFCKVIGSSFWHFYLVLRCLCACVTRRQALGAASSTLHPAMRVIYHHLRTEGCCACPPVHFMQERITTWIHWRSISTNVLHLSLRWQ